MFNKKDTRFTLLNSKMGEVILFIIAVILAIGIIWAWRTIRKEEPLEVQAGGIEISDTRDYGAVVLTPEETALLSRVVNKTATTGTDYSYAIKPNEGQAFLDLMDKLRRKAGLTQTEYYNEFVRERINANQVMRRLNVRAFQIEP